MADSSVVDLFAIGCPVKAETVPVARDSLDRGGRV